MSISIEIPDMERIRSTFGDHAKIIDTELRGAETAGLVVLRDAAKANVNAFAADGRLAGSVRYEPVSGGLSGIVGSVAATADSIEHGRDRGEAVNVGLLLGWINRKGIVTAAAAIAGARQSVKAGRGGTHRVVNRKKLGVNHAQLALAWKLRMAIIDHGTRPHPFIVPAAKSSMTKITELFDKAVAAALAKLVRS